MAHPVGTDSTRSPSDSRARRFASSSALALLLFLAVALGLGFGFGWKSLVPRMSEINFEEGLDMRLKLSEAGMAMAKDHPLFGTGPGTFASVCLLYPSPFPKSPWVFQLHDDWVETLITFGGVGSALIALAFLAVLAHWFARGGICTGCRFVILLWLAMAGCLVHAKVDFPFQIYSILFLFLIFCAMLSILSRRPGRA